MNTHKSNRKSFRVLDNVHLIYEVIDEATFQHGIERWKLKLGSGAGFRSKLLDIESRFKEKLLILQSEASPVSEALVLLNSKIDAVMEQLPELKESKMELAKEEPRKCEIGADGMLFGADQEYEPGTRMALRFLLAADSRYIETFCTVVSSEYSPDEDDTNRPCGIAVKFNGMLSAQKDIIVQHLFDRESETLRMRRLEIDSQS